MPCAPVVIALLRGHGGRAVPAPPVPPGSEPLEEPPPPPIVQGDPALEPQVTIRKDGENTVQEYRIKGKLYMMRVTPAHGRPARPDR